MSGRRAGSASRADGRVQRDVTADSSQQATGKSGQHTAGCGDRAVEYGGCAKHRKGGDGEAVCGRIGSRALARLPTATGLAGSLWPLYGPCPALWASRRATLWQHLPPNERSALPTTSAHPKRSCSCHVCACLVR